MTDYAGMRLRGLPFNLKNEDILTFFREYEVWPESVKIGRNQDNSRTGEGAVLFKSEQECKKAFQ